MIVVRLLGGLGNQMFQYAAGLALAERRRTVLKLDVGWFRERPEFEAHNRYGLSCFAITEQFATLEEIERAGGAPLTRAERWSLAAARALRLNRYANRFSLQGRAHCAKDAFAFDPGFFELPDNTYLQGMWQSERFFAPAAALVRLHFSFRYPMPAGVARMAERIRSGPSAAVHFRRGDYARNPTFHSELGVVDLGYYRAAVARLREACPGITLYVFSDDIDAVEREFDPAGPAVFVREVDHWHAYDKIRLMSLCDHAVISNSTFAWWGAWLNPNPGKCVIAPTPWHADRSIASGEIVPSQWTVLPRQ